MIGARPELVALATGHGDGIEGTVSVVELLGNEYLVTVERDDLTVQVTASDAPQPGHRVRVILDADRVLLYRRDDGGLVGSPRREEDDAATATAGSR